MYKHSTKEDQFAYYYLFQNLTLHCNVFIIIEMSTIHPVFIVYFENDGKSSNMLQEKSQ